MPPTTEDLELRTDTVDELIDLLESPLHTNGKMPRDRRRAVAERLRDQRTTQDAIALTGLPGSGKSHVAKKLSAVYNAPIVSMGDAIREEAPDDADSEELAEFAATWRQSAPEEIPEKVVEIADRYRRGHGEYAAQRNDLVIIDGVRSPTDHDVLSDHFDSFYLIRVKAEFYTRLDRLQERGREGEEKFTAVDLAERDETERFDLGQQRLIGEKRHDLTLENERGEGMLRMRLNNLLDENLPFEVEDAEPVLPPVAEAPEGAVTATSE